MVKSNGYTPTNKYFRNKFQDFASTKTKKGHLNNQGDEEGAKKLTGVLIKIDRKKIYSNGWLVETTDKKQYWCSYGDGVLCLPDVTESDSYYTPKKKIEVEISIDEDNKVYTLTRLKDPNKKPIALYSDKLELSVNTNEETNKDNKAKIEVSKNDVKIMGQTIAEAFTANSISIEETVATDIVVSNGTVTKELNSNSVKTEGISLYDDEEELNISPSYGIVGIDKGVITPTVLTEDIASHRINSNTLKVESITLGEDDLDNRLKALEQRIKDLEDGS